jgi:hypothetical protein
LRKAENVPKDINLNKVKTILSQKPIEKGTLNRLFYYSLIDFGSFEEDGGIPLSMLDQYRKEAKSLVKRVLKEHAYSIDRVSTNAYGKFETSFIANDAMSRLLIQRQLSELLGADYQVTEPDQAKPRSFDLMIAGSNYTIQTELKRVREWANYSDYVTDFLNKVDNYSKNSSGNHKFLFIVACAHEFSTKWMLKDTSHVAVFNDYISKVLKSHYVIEHVLSRTQMKGKVLIVIEHIVKDGKDSNSLMSFCDEIKEKIELNW